jgi:hypothetical protein
MYVDRKMRTVEAVPGMGTGVLKEDGGGGEFKYDVIDKL